MPGKIILASRLPHEADPTAGAAATLARRTGTELVLVYVAVELSSVAQLHASAGEDEEQLRGRILAEIDREVAAYVERNLPGEKVRARVEAGNVAEGVVRAAREERAEYLVIGTEGRGTLAQLVLGSTSHELLKRAPCPVLVVPTKGQHGS